MNKLITISVSDSSVQYLCKKDKRLAKGIALVGDLQYYLHDDGFDFLIHEIIEQMLSVEAGRCIYDRLAKLCNDEITVDQINLLTDGEIRSTGTSNAKVQFIRNLTNAIERKELCLDSLKKMSDKEAMKALTAIKGIGNWTAKMYLIFVLDRPDILPFEDGAFMQTYRWLYKTDDTSPKSIKTKCAKWSPYSSIADRYCYRLLDEGYTKKEFHLYKQID